MRSVALACLVAALPGLAIDRLIDFQQYRFGLPPAEFDYDATGPHGPVLSAGRPMWRTYVDLFAPSPKLVLIQASARAEADHYAIALLRDLKPDRVKLAVSFKLLGGDLARSAGILWQAQDKDEYYAVLVSGLDHDVCVLRMNRGRAAQLATAKVALDEKEWNVLEVSAPGERIAAWLNDGRVLEVRDQSLKSAGRVGLITRADTIALFDDFYIQSGEGRVVRKARLNLKTSASPAMRVTDISMTDADFKTPRAMFESGSRIYWQVGISDQREKPLPAAAVECEVAGPDGGIVGTEKAMTGSDGTALFSRSLSREATRGVYTVRVKAVVHSESPDAPHLPRASPKTVTKFEVR